ncbi:hypothetical protein SAMN04487831_11268 [Pseudobutyrivibrio sp. UC1225]|uniref:hypothetical protein n=1 Tax=Pseudobutyrivibrio sp. UC1225 TaxID=1798185 RepID=UPI0008E16BE2|nr:hypothetical protein [Pseudobutyrivibrio sp. UC1225]SFO21977.1 hypothetical protein SAMN04487831_11268 [Pseudobutyrivibrio sp. UC1225]
MKAKKWLKYWVLTVSILLGSISYSVVSIDPFFHYHKPRVNEYYYPLNNQRSQNDGIIKNFDYNAMITGTSMTENFKTSEMDNIFGCSSIKVSFSGASYKEINDNVERALNANKNLKIIVRGIDGTAFFSDSNYMRSDLGEYPEYLYDDNLLNDVNYLWNRDVIFGRVYNMYNDSKEEGFVPGITSFDEYSNWQKSFDYGIEAAGHGFEVNPKAEESHLSQEEKEIIKENIEKNLISVPDKYLDVDFYYFYTPYSILFWNDLNNNGLLVKQIEAEKYITELLLPHKNIHLFSFNSRTDIITDLNNYRDALHYAEWVNSLILKWMHEGKYQLTRESCEEYFRNEKEFFTNFDYYTIENQTDYEDDYYAGALLNQELTGIKPVDVLNDDRFTYELSDSLIIDNEGIKTGVDCFGTLGRNPMDEDLSTYLKDSKYIGLKFNINKDRYTRYLCFKGQKIKDHGSLAVCVYNSEGDCVDSKAIEYYDMDSDVHTYTIKLPDGSDTLTIIMNGGYIDNTGSIDSNYQFSDIFLY